MQQSGSTDPGVPVCSWKSCRTISLGRTILMAKARIQYVCFRLRWKHNRNGWEKCPDCGEWNTLQEFVVRAPEKTRGTTALTGAMPVRPVALPDIPKESMRRLPLRIEEFEPRSSAVVSCQEVCVLVGGETWHRQEYHPHSDGCRGHAQCRSPCSMSVQRKVPHQVGTAGGAAGASRDEKTLCAGRNRSRRAIVEQIRADENLHLSSLTRFRPSIAPIAQVPPAQ